ncbi:MAG: hypothetical protein ACK5MT_06800 [Actinomycetales bacterium]
MKLDQVEVSRALLSARWQAPRTAQALAVTSDGLCWFWSCGSPGRAARSVGTWCAALGPDLIREVGAVRGSLTTITPDDGSHGPLAGPPGVILSADGVRHRVRLGTDSAATLLAPLVAARQACLEQPRSVVDWRVRLLAVPGGRPVVAYAVTGLGSEPVCFHLDGQAMAITSSTGGSRDIDSPRMGFVNDQAELLDGLYATAQLAAGQTAVLSVPLPEGDGGTPAFASATGSVRLLGPLGAPTAAEGPFVDFEMVAALEQT